MRASIVLLLVAAVLLAGAVAALTFIFAPPPDPSPAVVADDGGSLPSEPAPDPRPDRDPWAHARRVDADRRHAEQAADAARASQADLTGPGTDEEHGDASAEDDADDADDPLAALRTHEAVKEAVERFFTAIRTGDQQGLEQVFDVEAFTPSMGGHARECQMTPEGFVAEYFSVAVFDSPWRDYLMDLDLQPDMTGGFNHRGKEMWYWEADGKGRARYLATPPDGPDPYHIALELELDPDTHRWRVTTIDDPKYKPWEGPQMYAVIYEGKVYHVPEDEYFAHKQAYKSEQRKPPPPWDVPVE